MTKCAMRGGGRGSGASGVSGDAGLASASVSASALASASAKSGLVAVGVTPAGCWGRGDGEGESAAPIRGTEGVGRLGDIRKRSATAGGDTVFWGAVVAVVRGGGAAFVLDAAEASGRGPRSSSVSSRNPMRGLASSGTNASGARTLAGLDERAAGVALGVSSGPAGVKRRFVANESGVCVGRAMMRIRMGQ